MSMQLPASGTSGTTLPNGSASSSSGLPARKALYTPSDIDAAAAGALESERAAATSVTAAAAEATRAETARAGSETARTAAQTARTGAEAARTGAEAAQAAAQVAPFDGAPIASGVNLNAIVRRGVYRQGAGSDATAALNYPAPGTGGVMEVFTPNGRDTHIVQRYTPFGQGATVQGRVFYERMQETDSTGWRPWHAYSSQRVDQTAGRAVYTWDDLNNREQLIYGDTGRRDVLGTVLNGWSPYAGSLVLRRVGSLVTLEIDYLDPSAATSDELILTPAGFRPFQTSRYAVWAGNTPVFLIATSARISLPRSVRAPNGGPAVVMWLTSDPWPSVLPGVAVGGVPNG